MLKSVLMVCLGNICRSPMAEGLLKARIGDDYQDMHIASAGLSALVGYPADPLAVAVMQERGIDISEHRARQLTPEMVYGSEMVLVMERQQRKLLEQAMPAARGRVFLIGHWDNTEIDDPYGQSRKHFEKNCDRIELTLDSWMERFGG